MLEGGPSHSDMWDLKPDAPKEIRGPFNPISTNVPGTQIGNVLTHCAKIADKYTILRSHSHKDNAHQILTEIIQDARLNGLPVQTVATQRRESLDDSFSKITLASAEPLPEEAPADEAEAPENVDIP